MSGFSLRLGARTFVGHIILRSVITEDRRPLPVLICTGAFPAGVLHARETHLADARHARPVLGEDRLGPDRRGPSPGRTSATC